MTSSSHDALGEAMNDISYQAAAIILMFGVVPIWIAAGLADYLCHRASRIAETSGTTESVLHLVQFSLIGLPVSLALFLESNAGFLIMAMVFLALHHIVGYVDVRYASCSPRVVAPVEQMIHSVLEMAPIMAFALLAILSWPQMLALIGLGPEQARYLPGIRLLPTSYAVSVLASAFVLNALPYVEELLRCLLHGSRVSTEDDVRR